MTAPRVEVRLDLIRHNAATLVGSLARRGIAVTGVTKATIGSPEVAQEMLAAGVSGLGESRFENLVALRQAGVDAPLTLLRSPMLSQVEQVVTVADRSLNTEPEVIRALSAAAEEQGRVHGVILMVELGDLREGIMPADLPAIAAETESLPGVELDGIGTNLGCQSGVVPDPANMAVLSELGAAVEGRNGRPLAVVSGGNSASLGWALGDGDVGTVNDLRLGESILLGVDPLDRRPLAGLHTDAFDLVAEVIESKVKPTRPWGEIGQAAFGDPVAGSPPVDAPGPGGARRVIVALGHQDIDPGGLTPPTGYTTLGASSDHLVLDPGPNLASVGTELHFGVNYSALLRAMGSPFVRRTFIRNPS